MLNNLNIPDKKSIAVIVVITALLLGWLLLTSPADYKDEHGEQEAEIHKGPHGGRLLSQDDFSLEITVYESGLPPEFRVYAYYDNKPVSPDKVKLDIKLERLGNKFDRIGFVPQQDYLRGNTVVYEPHSFNVTVQAIHNDKSYTWEFENFEGRTSIPDQIAMQMRLKTTVAGPVKFQERRTLTGRIEANPNRLSRVSPRFTGVIQKVHRELGDHVLAGDILATIQSNTSLHDYKLKAPISGLIVKREIQVGETPGDTPLFVIADLSDVWVELDVFARDLDKIIKGQTVVVETLEGKYLKTGRIDWISPLTAHASQSVRIRATLTNKDGVLRPGQFVLGQVTIAEETVPLAVPQSALQSFRDFQVVFAKVNETYEVRMLELGRRNSEWVEVLSGIEAGTQYVTDNSYLIKADIDKSGASHDH